MKKIINKILLVLCISFISIFCIASNEKSYTNVNAETSVE